MLSKGQAGDVGRSFTVDAVKSEEISCTYS